MATYYSCINTCTTMLQILYHGSDNQYNYGGEFEGSSNHEFEDYEFENYMYSGLKYSTFQGGIKIDLNF